jgi:hypothetical protein
MLCKEITPVYSENHAKPINTKYRMLLLKQVTHIVTTQL